MTRAVPGGRPQGAGVLLGISLLAVLAAGALPAHAETATVDVDGNQYGVEYEATGLTVGGVEADLEAFSLIITVDVTEDQGTLEITFDRDFFDVDSDAGFGEFIVLVDLDEVDSVTTTTTDQNRTLVMTLPFGTDEIEIIGDILAGNMPDGVAGNPPADDPPADDPPADDAVPDPPVQVPPEVPPADDPPVTQPPADGSQATQTPPEMPDDDPPTPPTPPAPPETDPADTCGEGTILRGGECVIDDRCGEGTVLADGVCVVDQSSRGAPAAPASAGRDLVFGFIAAFVVAGIVGIFLALVSRGSRG